MNNGAAEWRGLREFARVAGCSLQRVRLRPANWFYELFSSSTGRMAEQQAECRAKRLAERQPLHQCTQTIRRACLEFKILALPIRLVCSINRLDLGFQCVCAQIHGSLLAGQREYETSLLVCIPQFYSLGSTILNSTGFRRLPVLQSGGLRELGCVSRVPVVYTLDPPANLLLNQKRQHFEVSGLSISL